MRTQVIPAQITTVEDKIAGNLNLTQIMLLLFPAVWTTIVFTIFTPRLHLSLYKLPIILVVIIACILLSLRIKGRVVLNWVFTILHYNSRPKYYIFDKNEDFLRTMDLPDLTKKHRVHVKKEHVKEDAKAKPAVAIGDLVKLDNLFTNPKYSFSFKSAKKGGIDVAFKQEQK